MLNYYVMTLFPEMIESTLGYSITGRALEKELISLEAINIRDYAQNKSRHVDDYIYGGGFSADSAVPPIRRLAANPLFFLLSADPQIFYVLLPVSSEIILIRL